MRIPMVLTSHDQLGNTGREGFWVEELAALLRHGRPPDERRMKGAIDERGTSRAEEL